MITAAPVLASTLHAGPERIVTTAAKEPVQFHAAVTDAGAARLAAWVGGVRAKIDDGAPLFLATADGAKWLRTAPLRVVPLDAEGNREGPARILDGASPERAAASLDRTPSLEDASRRRAVRR